MIGQIEQAVQVRLRSASDGGSLGYRLKSVDSYAGQLETSPELPRLLPVVPAAWVSLREATLKAERVNGRYEMVAVITVLVATQNKWSEQSARYGSATPQAVGSYQIAQDALTLLSNQSLGLEITPLAPLAVRVWEPLKVGAKVGMTALSVISVDFQTSFFLDGLPNIPVLPLPSWESDSSLEAVMTKAAGITPFAQIHADWLPLLDHRAPSPEGTLPYHQVLPLLPTVSAP